MEYLALMLDILLKQTAKDKINVYCNNYSYCIVYFCDNIRMEVKLGIYFKPGNTEFFKGWSNFKKLYFYCLYKNYTSYLGT